MRPSRRQLLLGLTALGAAGLVWRVSGYRGERGEVFTAWELAVLTAAAEALLPPAPGPYDRVAGNVDRFVRGMSPDLLRELHALILVVEHGTLLAGEAHRFTALDVEARLGVVAALDRVPRVGPTIVRGLRDLVVLGYYQDPATWPALGYDGPHPPTPLATAYEALRAPPGHRPRSLR